LLRLEFSTRIKVKIKQLPGALVLAGWMLMVVCAKSHLLVKRIPNEAEVRTA